MELSKIEERAVMLETQTPAYARTDEIRRAIDLNVRRANNLRRAFRDARVDVPVAVRAIVPHKHDFVSGLNVPSNFKIVVGKEERRSFDSRLRRAKRALEARNAK